MPPIRLAFFAALLSSLIAAPASADNSRRTINITGQATLSVTPDTARLLFAVVTISPRLETARAENAAAMRRVLEALRDLKLPPMKTTTRPDGTLETSPGLDLQTGSVDVQPLDAERRSRTEPRAIVGYQITNSAVARYHDPNSDKLAATMSRILDTVLENGANQVSEMELFLRDDEAAKQKALVAALANARRRAELVAREAGVKIRAVRSIETGYSYAARGRALGSDFDLPEGAGGALAYGIREQTPLVAGTLLFSSTINVTYEIE
ncbi:MAG: SIMPL domain-containing protein [Armatimonadetes bacterium]|nr:SIMPL domain-containing protein [Armatimonadota bacterium]